MWAECIFSTRRIQFRVWSVQVRGQMEWSFANAFCYWVCTLLSGWERCFLLFLFPWELIEVFFLSLAVNLNSIEVMSMWITMYFQCPSVVFGKTSFSLGYHTGYYITDICLKSQLSSLPAAMKTEASVFPLCWARYSPAPCRMKIHGLPHAAFHPTYISASYFSWCFS